MRRLHFRIVDPVVEPNLARAFDDLQAACNVHYDVGHADADWSPAGRLIVTHGGSMVAGLSFHDRARGPLPVEQGGSWNARVAAEVEVRAPAGVAELAGLWAAPEIAPSSVGTSIVAAAVAVAPLHAVHHLLMLGHPGTPALEPVGFIAAADDDDDGDGARPRRYWCDADACTGASPDMVKRIRMLRSLYAVGGALPLEVPVDVPDPRA